MKNNRGFSLIGVLAALVIFSAVMVLLLRLNHLLEQRFYAPLDRENNLSTHAWLLVRGQPIPDFIKRDAVKTQNEQLEGITYTKVTEGDDTFYIIPAPNQARRNP